MIVKAKSLLIGLTNLVTADLNESAMAETVFFPCYENEK
jgi:hypothetical protein